MRKTLISVVAIVLCVAMMFSLTGCTQKSEIKSLIGQFENACNELDFNAVLDCITPKTADSIKMAAGFVGMFTDTSSEEMFDSLSKFMTSDNIGGTDFFSSIKIDVKEIEITEDKATVLTDLTYEINDKKATKEATIKCELYNEKWYIVSF